MGSGCPFLYSSFSMVLLRGSLLLFHDGVTRDHDPIQEHGYRAAWHPQKAQPRYSILSHRGLSMY